MSEQEFKNELIKIGININNDQLNKFRCYAEFLMEYNNHTNLTAIKNIEDIYLKHFYDSVLLLKDFKLNNERILDIGSGAGFPGVPLKIIMPNVDLTLLDSNGKKTKFLEELRDKLDIDYSVINDRAEKFVKNNREQFDIVVSRAVTAMPALAELSIPFVKVDGFFIPYKGKLDSDLEGGNYAISTLGCEIEKSIIEILPKEGATRTFVIAKKKCKTDISYPRLFEKIIKKPLQK